MNNTEICTDFEILIQEINEICDLVNNEFDDSFENHYVDIFDALDYIAEKLKDFILGR